MARMRKQMTELLRESEGRFRNMADNAPVMVWVTEPDGQASFLSVRWYEFTGQDPRAALGFGWLEAVHPEDRAEVERGFVTANNKREPYRAEYRLRGRDVTIGIVYAARARSGANWQHIRVPQLLWLSTALILASSWTLENARAWLNRKNGRRCWVT